MDKHVCTYMGVYKRRLSVVKILFSCSFLERHSTSADLNVAKKMKMRLALLFPRLVLDTSRIKVSVTKLFDKQCSGNLSYSS